jgi:septal ring factor EnvC (AmiA/AmiB activator)
MARKAKTVADVEAELRQVRKELETAFETIGAQKADAQSRAVRVREQDEAIKTLTAENNGLRDQLFEASQELARRAGYMQAIEDQQPAPAQHKPSRSIDGNVAYIVGQPEPFHLYGEDRASPRRWYHR